MRTPPESIQKIREEQGIKLPAEIELVPLADLQANPRNSRLHSEDQIGRICKSLQAFGWTKPIIVSEDGKTILAGHGLAEAARRLGMEKVPVIKTSLRGKLADACMIADNRIGDLSTDAPARLKDTFEYLDTGEFDMSFTAYTEAELEQMMTAVYQGEEEDKEIPPIITLAERFGVPPFSVLDARQGYWQQRKKAWLSLGIKSEMGRGENLLSISPSGRLFRIDHSLWSRMKFGADRDFKKDLLKAIKQEIKNDEDAERRKEKLLRLIRMEGTSIFDPVLCELAYRWFSPPGGKILDPFAGGSVRGIVAAKLGREYVGIDVRGEQVEENREQAKSICNGSSLAPIWTEGDSLNIKTLAPGEYDFIFTSPPYPGIEHYSDDSHDLSSMTHAAFIETYRKIIENIVSMLKQDRFACFVVGEARDKKKGFLVNFVRDTIASFQDAGAQFYVDAVLIMMIGNLVMRARKPFEGSRKLGMAHQNVLVFVKGDPKKATEAIGPVEFGEIEGMEEEAETE